MEKIAIIGSGIAGLGCAWFLHRKFDITLFEADNRIGGHTHTVTIPEGDSEVAFDTWNTKHSVDTSKIEASIYTTRDKDSSVKDSSFQGIDSTQSQIHKSRNVAQG